MLSNFKLPTFPGSNSGSNAGGGSGSNAGGGAGGSNAGGSNSQGTQLQMQINQLQTRVAQLEKQQIHSLNRIVCLEGRVELLQTLINMARRDASGRTELPHRTSVMP